FGQPCGCAPAVRHPAARARARARAPRFLEQRLGESSVAVVTRPTHGADTLDMSVEGVLPPGVVWWRFLAHRPAAVGADAGTFKRDALFVGVVAFILLGRFGGENPGA